jgi:hypothetical protein
MRHGVL